MTVLEESRTAEDPRTRVRFDKTPAELAEAEARRRQREQEERQERQEALLGQSGGGRGFVITLLVVLVVVLVVAGIYYGAKWLSQGGLSDVPGEADVEQVQPIDDALPAGPYVISYVDNGQYVNCPSVDSPIVSYVIEKRSDGKLHVTTNGDERCAAELERLLNPPPR